LVINKANLSITFPNLPEKKYGDPPFTLSATVNPAASGLMAGFTSSDPQVATISGNTVTIVGAGTTTITASQPGNANYKPAASVNRVLTVTGLPQTIGFGNLPVGLKYGDDPFTVSATINTGLPITFRSSDPTVATVSGNVVTIVGAGQCSILAVQEGNSMYAYAAVARPLFVAPAEHLPLPPAALFQTYDGTPKGIDPATLPGGAAAQIRYRETNQPEPASLVPQIAFQNGPDTLNLSYNSTPFQASQVWGTGTYVQLAGTARKLHSCDVTLVTWAQYSDNAQYGYLGWAAQNPTRVVPPTPGVSVPGDSGGWRHPITLSFYDYDDQAQTWKCIAQKTETDAFIPWRPMKLADGTNYPWNGYAFRVPFEFEDGVILPEEVWVTVSFNTSTAGEAPVGAAGPYDALNVAWRSSMVAGADLLSSYQLLYKQWMWTSTPIIGVAAPMLRLRTVPTIATLTPPTGVGTYEAKTVFTGKGVGGEATTALTIGYDFAGWKAREISLGRLPIDHSGDADDPDKDGFTNLQEYAFNLNPGAPDATPGHPPAFSLLTPNLGFTYRRNLQAVDLTFAIEGSPDLADPASWNPVEPLEESILSDDGVTRVIRATVPRPSDADGYFLRLKVGRNPQP
jgi:hypothetical protein